MSAKKKYTPEELAEAMVFPVKLTASQKKEAAEQLAAARKISAQQQTEEGRLTLGLFQLKFHLEDYVNGKEYEPEKHFGHFLKRYIDILGIKRKAFAEDISIDETMLSQYINMHRTPPDYVSIRLELHSNNIIPAEYWYRLVEMQKEYQIRTDKALRKKERKFVHKLAITL
jgi:plasmid maintenance system antidote protein VapI